MGLRKSLLVDLAMILALILLGVIGYKLSPLLMPKADVFVQPDSSCDLNRAACVTMLPRGGRLSFAIAPRPIPVTRPLDLRVEIEGGSADKVVVDFAGVDMSMGFNRRVLTSVGQGKFAGETVLPVCVTGRMLWQATVLIESGGTRIAVPFHFEAGH